MIRNSKKMGTKKNQKKTFRKSSTETKQKCKKHLPKIISHESDLPLQKKTPTPKKNSLCPPSL